MLNTFLKGKSPFTLNLICSPYVAESVPIYDQLIMGRVILKLTQSLFHPNIASVFANSTIGSDILLTRKHPGCETTLMLYGGVVKLFDHILKELPPILHQWSSRMGSSQTRRDDDLLQSLASNLKCQWSKSYFEMHLARVGFERTTLNGFVQESRRRQPPSYSSSQRSQLTSRTSSSSSSHNRDLDEATDKFCVRSFKGGARGRTCGRRDCQKLHQFPRITFGWELLLESTRFLGTSQMNCEHQSGKNEKGKPRNQNTPKPETLKQTQKMTSIFSLFLVIILVLPWWIPPHFSPLVLSFSLTTGISKGLFLNNSPPHQMKVFSRS